MKIYYNPKLKKLARKLRNNMSPPEILLWNQLKRKKLRGYDFHRQKPINNYIVDFFCQKLSLIIEVDGEIHIDKGKADIARQIKLESLGLKVLGFKASDIMKNLNYVIEAIVNYIEVFEKE